MLDLVLGGVLEASWSDLGRFFGGQDAPKTAQDGGKMAHDGAKTAQDGAKIGRVGTKTRQDDAKTLQESATTGQVDAKIDPEASSHKTGSEFKQT